MKVAIVGPTHPYKGGIAQSTTTLARQLGAAGHVVDVVSWSAQYPDFLYPGEQRVPADRPEVEPWPRATYPLAWYRPDGWVRTGRRLRAYDVVVFVLVTPVQVPAYLTMLAALGRRPSVRTVVLCHNVLPHERRMVDPTLVRALFRRTDGALVHSGDQARMARGLGARQVAVAELPSGFPTLAGAEPAVVPDADVHRRLLFFGLVRPYKGLDILLAALAKVPGVGLTVAGEFWGETLRVTELTVDELGLRDRVEIRAGYVDAAEVPALFAGTDALVLPYRQATSSYNADVAFQYGAPVVVTRAGALADRVSDGVDGLVCAPDDVDDLAAALRRLYGEPGLLAALRAGVRPPDHTGKWERYAEALLAAAG
ncbi:MAG: glycosyltransferase [Streptosporangiales bacterium]|nr:glycosyltransferase [Streptosporangiales bacterium]